MSSKLMMANAISLGMRPRIQGVVVVLEDNLLLSDVKDAPAMALKAGFTDVRVVVYWRGTRNMAEVLFGPVVRCCRVRGVSTALRKQKGRN
jgi:hypothetical protein